MKAPFFSFAFAVVVFASSISVAQTSYTITDLGTLNSNGYSVSRAVNLSAEVTGAAGLNNSNSSQVFLYSGGKMTGLGTLGGPLPGPGRENPLGRMAP